MCCVMIHLHASENKVVVFFSNKKSAVVVIIVLVGAKEMLTDN